MWSDTRWGRAPNHELGRRERLHTMSRSPIYIAAAAIGVSAILILAMVGPGGFVPLLPFLPFLLVIWWAGRVLFALRDIAHELRALREDVRRALPLSDRSEVDQ